MEQPKIDQRQRQKRPTSDEINTLDRGWANFQELISDNNKKDGLASIHLKAPNEVLDLPNELKKPVRTISESEDSVFGIAGSTAAHSPSSKLVRSLSAYLEPHQPPGDNQPSPNPPRPTLS